MYVGSPLLIGISSDTVSAFLFKILTVEMLLSNSKNFKTFSAIKKIIHINNMLWNSSQ